MLLTWNNLAYYQRLMQDIRDAIEGQRFAERVGGDQRRQGDGRAGDAGYCMRPRDSEIDAAI